MNVFVVFSLKVSLNVRKYTYLHVHVCMCACADAVIVVKLSNSEHISKILSYANCAVSGNMVALLFPSGKKFSTHCSRFTASNCALKICDLIMR